MISDEMIELVKPFLKTKVLDVGCGDAEIKKYARQYTGIDIQGKYDKKVNLEKQKIPFPDKTFDTSVCFDVIEHVENPVRLLKEINRVTKKNIILNVPNDFYLKNRLRILLGRNLHAGYVCKPFYDHVKKIGEGNRHKWFSNYFQSEYLIREQFKSRKYDITITPLTGPIFPLTGPLSKFNFIIKTRTLKYLTKRNPNLFALSMFVHIKKTRK